MRRLGCRTCRPPPASGRIARRCACGPRRKCRARRIANGVANSLFGVEHDRQLNVVAITDPLGRSAETYVLDENERVVAVTNVEGQAMAREYCVGDFVSAETRFDGTEVAYGYDTDGTEVSYARRNGGGVASMTSVAGTTAYSYGAADRWTGMAAPAGSFGFGYCDWNGKLAAVTNVNGFVVEYEYDIMDRVTNISWKTASGATLGGFAYEYDAVGRIVSRSHTLGDPSQPSQMSQSSEKTYAYDSLDRLASDDGVAYTYDAAGNRTTRHVYDDNWQVVADLDEQDNVIASYTWGDGIDHLLAVKVGGSTYYPLTDMQGTVWGYVDSQNDVVARWQYDAWGNVVSESVSVPALASLRYRFQGREWSAATGLVNFRMRWYDPETGRWLSKDPIGLSGGMNLYAFCGSDPMCRVDHLGCKATGTVINNSQFTLWAKPEDGVNPFKVKPGETISSIDGFVIPDTAPGRVFKVPGSVTVKVDSSGKVTAEGLLDSLILKLRGGWQNSSFGDKHPDWKPVMRKAVAPEKKE